MGVMVQQQLDGMSGSAQQLGAQHVVYEVTPAGVQLAPGATVRAADARQHVEDQTEEGGGEGASAPGDGVMDQAAGAHGPGVDPVDDGVCHEGGNEAGSTSRELAAGTVDVLGGALGTAVERDGTPEVQIGNTVFSLQSAPRALCDDLGEEESEAAGLSGVISSSPHSHSDRPSTSHSHASVTMQQSHSQSSLALDHAYAEPAGQPNILPCRTPATYGSSAGSVVRSQGSVTCSRLRACSSSGSLLDSLNKHTAAASVGDMGANSCDMEVARTGSRPPSRGSSMGGASNHAAVAPTGSHGSRAGSVRSVSAGRGRRGSLGAAAAQGDEDAARLLAQARAAEMRRCALLWMLGLV